MRGARPNACGAHPMRARSASRASTGTGVTRRAARSACAAPCASEALLASTTQETHYDQRADYNTFLQDLPRLLVVQRGKVAVVHEREIVGFYDGMEEAIAFGDSRFGFGPEHFIAQ